MSRPDDFARLNHMLSHAVEAVQMAQARTRQDLDRDRQLNLALVRLLEVIGEAASRVTPETCHAHSAISWSAITAMRNRLIHGYDDVDFDILWDVIQQDLPVLIAELRRALGR